MTDIRSLIYSGHGDTLNYGFADLEGATDSYHKALVYQPSEKTLSFQYVEALYEQERIGANYGFFVGLLFKPSDVFE